MIFPYRKGVGSMQNIYGIGIKEEKRPYCWAWQSSLEELDQYILTNGKEKVLAAIKAFDPNITEKDPEKIVIEQYLNGDWKVLNDFIITDSLVLTFSMAELLSVVGSQKVLNILFNHFEKSLNKPYISENFRETIVAMQKDSQSFLTSFDKCSYEEQRKIRQYVSKRINLHDYIKVEEETKTGEKEKNIDQLEILKEEEYTLKKVA